MRAMTPRPGFTREGLSMSPDIDVIVIGASQGGLTSLATLIEGLSDDMAIPIIVVLHQAKTGINKLPDLLQPNTRLKIVEAQSHQPLQSGYIYLAPPGYHTLLEADRTLSLSVDLPVHHSIPAIDVLFESAADAFGPAVLGVLLTGNSQDGTVGLGRIKKYAGLAIVQNPESAIANIMPRSAIENCDVDHIAELKDIAALVESICAG